MIFNYNGDVLKGGKGIKEKSSQVEAKIAAVEKFEVANNRREKMKTEVFLVEQELKQADSNHPKEELKSESFHTQQAFQ